MNNREAPATQFGQDRGNDDVNPFNGIVLETPGGGIKQLRPGDNLGIHEIPQLNLNGFASDRFGRS